MSLATSTTLIHAEEQNHTEPSWTDLNQHWTKMIWGSHPTNVAGQSVSTWSSERYTDKWSAFRIQSVRKQNKYLVLSLRKMTKYCGHIPLSCSSVVSSDSQLLRGVVYHLHAIFPSLYWSTLISKAVFGPRLVPSWVHQVAAEPPLRSTLLPVATPPESHQL